MALQKMMWCDKNQTHKSCGGDCHTELRTKQKPRRTNEQYGKRIAENKQKSIRVNNNAANTTLIWMLWIKRY